MTIAKNSLDGVMYDFNIHLILEKSNSSGVKCIPKMDSELIPFVLIMLEYTDKYHIEYRTDRHFCYFILNSSKQIAVSTTLKESINYIFNVLQA